MCIDCKYYQGKCTNPNECANKKELEQIRADVIDECISRLDTIEQISFGIVDVKLLKIIFNELKEQK